jgi:hypothetical protein
MCWQPNPSSGYFHDTVLFTEHGEQASPRDHNHTPPLTVVQPGDGQTGELGSIGVNFKL